MKLIGRALVCFVALAAFTISLGLQAEAAHYLGQVTWTWHKTRDEQGPWPAPLMRSI